MSINSATPLLSLELILEKISEITLQIQQHENLESILQGAIADVRSLLQTDRVLIDRFLENQDIVVAFESIGTEWSSTLGSLICNPCFDADWVECCQQGQIITLSDIHSETIDAFHLLERLEVQAILLVPIFSQSTLWGLLTVHHCRSPREWQPLEAQLLRHIALQLGLAIQHAECRHPQPLESQLEQHTIDRRHTAIFLPANQDAVENWNLTTHEIWFSLQKNERERQQSEAVLRRYERIVSATPDMVSLIDRNYLYQVVNQSYLIWNQKSYDEIVGHSISDLLGQEFFETVSKPLLDRCLAGESQQSFDAWQTYANGQRRYVRATYAPYVELDGTISGVVINVHDLTDLKLVEEAFRESEERFRQMASSIYEVFWMADIDFTQIIYVSPGYEEIWGRSCTSLYEQPKSFLESIHQEDRAQVLAIVEQQRLTGFSHEYRLLRPDGTLRWIWERTFPVLNATGYPYRLVGVSRDITDRKVAETALREQQQFTEQIAESTLAILYVYDLIEQYNIRRCATFNWSPSDQTEAVRDHSDD